MPEKVTRVGVIGTGYIAHTHAEVLASLPRAVLDSVCDVDLVKAKSFADRWRVANVFCDIDELLSSQPPDAAHVVVPPSLHARIALPFLERGIAVFLEKPIALSVEDGERLVDVAKKNNAALGVNHNVLFHPQVARARKEITAGAIGRVQHVIASVSIPLRQLDAGQIGHWMFQDPRNLVLELMPHTFSIVQAVLGSCRSVRVSLSGRRELVSGASIPKSWQIDLKCQGGTAQIYFLPGGEFEEWWVSFLGQDGSIRVDLTYDLYEDRGRTEFLPALDQFFVGRRAGRRIMRDAWHGIRSYALSKVGVGGRSDRFYVGMRDSIAAFHNAVSRGESPPVSGDDGCEVVRYCQETVSTEALGSYRPAGTQPVATKRQGADLLITGATGFIGGHFLENLAREPGRGPRVRALVRRMAGLPSWIANESVELATGDLTSPDALTKAVQGCRMVIHLATGGGDTWEELETSMIGGARALARACIEHDCHLVFVSTIAALYLGDGGETITNATPLDPLPQKRALYSRAKAACERQLQELREQDGLKVTIVRPGVVIGARGVPYHSGVGYWVNPQHCLGFSTGNHPLALVLVEDVASALVSLVELGGVNGGCLNLVGDVRWTSLEYVRRLTEASGRRIHFHPHTPLGLEVVDGFKWLVKRVGGQNVSFPSLRDFKSRGMPATFDCTETKELLRWSPVSDDAEFLEKAILCHFQREVP